MSFKFNLIIFLVFIGGLKPFNMFSQSVNIGLLSTLEFNNIKLQPKINSLDLTWHNKIDSVSNISSFLNKVVQINKQNFYISIHTKSTMDDLIFPFKKGKAKYDTAEYFIYQNAHFACYRFKMQSKYIHRIIFSEPKLTTVILIDYIDDRNKMKNFNYKTIIQGIKLNSRIH